MQADILARLNLEKDIFKAENEIIYSTNDHLWRSRLCPRTENTLPLLKQSIFDPRPENCLSFSKKSL